MIDGKMTNLKNKTFIFLCLPGFFLISWGLTGCNYLFYYPNQLLYSTPAQFRLDFETVEFSSKDGTKLKGWFIPAHNVKNAKGTVIQFHGNAQNMSSHYRSLIWLPHHGYNLFTFDYRGFGLSEGEPDHHGPVFDSVAAIDYVRNRTGENSGKLILLGQSIGGALAVAAATHGSKDGVKAVVIESSFSSFQRITRDKLGEVSLTWPFQWPLSLIFVRDTYSPEDWVDQLSPVPVLFIHGTADTVVNYYHSEILYRAAREPKYFWTIEGGQHIQAFIRFDSIYREKLLNFLNQMLEVK
ncbi:MAG: alpha/beta hydrolase [SAR324 cluster bacterium]|nr:alpha/beta hydrolase [SAR324 cluster bacterium]